MVSACPADPRIKRMHPAAASSPPVPTPNTEATDSAVAEATDSNVTEATDSSLTEGTIHSANLCLHTAAASLFSIVTVISLSFQSLQSCTLGSRLMSRSCARMACSGRCTARSCVTICQNWLPPWFRTQIRGSLSLLFRFHATKYECLGTQSICMSLMV